VTRQFCDRCRRDITNVHSSAVSIVADADRAGSGTVTKQVDICARCRKALEHWLLPEPANLTRERRRRPGRS
jgi:hypothetical protein